jgi:hypothetical protein
LSVVSKNIFTFVVTHASGIAANVGDVSQSKPPNATAEALSVFCFIGISSCHELSAWISGAVVR